MEYLTSSKRWSRKLSDIEPLKSSIGEISSKISSRPERSGTSLRPSAFAAATRACQRSFPRSQSKLSVWSARRSGTSRGSRIFAKDRRPEGVCAVDMFVAERAAAKEGPSTGLFSNLQIRADAWLRSRVPGSVVVPLSGTESRTKVAKGEHGQRKGLAYRQRAGESSRVKRRRSSAEALIRSQQTGCPRRDLPRPPDRGLAMRTRRIWTLP